jgi:ribosomal protein S18 acetylase RimI-like enzyme
MRRATELDRDLVIEILAESFDDNRSVNYIVKPDKNRQQRIKALMSYSFDMCSLFGEVYINEEKTGCALILYPHKKKTTLKALWLDLKLVVNSIGISRAGKAMSRESQIKGRYPKEPFYYLWFIGVNKSAQHQGEGSKLLSEVIKDAEKQSLPILLETSTLKNIPWYNRFNFETYDEIEFTYPLFMLKRA